MAGRLSDGALLVVHNPEAEDIPVALTEPLRTPDGENTSRIILVPGNADGWNRFGRDYVRFLDEEICKFTPSADGVVRCRMLVDPRKGVADLYVNGSENPVLRNRAFITAGQEQCVSFGDGSVAIKGMCELYGATAALYGVSGQPALRERRSADAAPSATLTPQNHKKWELHSSYPGSARNSRKQNIRD